MRRNILIAIALIASQVSIAQVLTNHSVDEKRPSTAIKSEEVIQNVNGIIEYHNGEKPVTERKNATIETVSEGGIIEYHNGEKPVTERKSATVENTSVGGIIEYHNGEKPVTERKNATVENAPAGGIIEYHNGEKPVTERKNATLENAPAGGIIEYHNGEKPVTERKNATVENASMGGVIEYHNGEKPARDIEEPVMLTDDELENSGDARGDEEDPNVIDGVELNAKVFPNPFEDSFTVFLSADVPYAHVKIVSPYGKIIQERTINEQAQFDLNGFDEGVYVVQLSSSRDMLMKRIIKR